MGRLKVRLTEGSNVRVPWCSGRTLKGSMVADLRCQFARVVKGVDLRSTAGNCAWARTPQLTHLCPRNAQPYTLSGSAFSTPKSIRSLYLMRPGLRTRRRWRRWPSEREGGGVPCEPDGRIECALARGSSHRLGG